MGAIKKRNKETFFKLISDIVIPDVTEIYYTGYILQVVLRVLIIICTTRAPHFPKGHLKCILIDSSCPGLFYHGYQNIDNNTFSCSIYQKYFRCINWCEVSAFVGYKCYNYDRRLVSSLCHFFSIEYMRYIRLLSATRITRYTLIYPVRHKQQDWGS